MREISKIRVAEETRKIEEYMDSVLNLNLDHQNSHQVKELLVQTLVKYFKADR